MELENIFLESCSYKDIPSNSLVLNSDELPYYLLIHLPEGVALDYRLYQLDEIGVQSYICNIEQNTWSAHISDESDQSVYRRYNLSVFFIYFADEQSG